jgi:hypothetical protein
MDSLRASRRRTVPLIVCDRRLIFAAAGISLPSASALQCP